MPRAQWTRGRRRLAHQGRLARVARQGQKDRLGREESWTSPWALAGDHLPLRPELGQWRLAAERLPQTTTWAEARQPLAAEDHQARRPTVRRSPFKRD